MDLVCEVNCTTGVQTHRPPTREELLQAQKDAEDDATRAKETGATRAAAQEKRAVVLDALAKAADVPVEDIVEVITAQVSGGF